MSNNTNENTPDCGTTFDSGTPTWIKRGAGVWAPTTASEFGYRVHEVFGGVNITAVGRNNEIAGSLAIEGTRASTANEIAAQA